MSNSENDKRFAEAIRAQLDDSLNDYDAATLSRLNQARQRALDELPKAGRLPWHWPALAFASALALVVLIGFPGGQVQVSPEMDDVALVDIDLSDDEMALLASDDDLEMLQDLEFYAWLEQQQDWDGSSS